MTRIRLVATIVCVAPAAILFARCGGHAGANGESVIVTQEPGGANCPNGGVKVQVGSAAPAYVCGGASGAATTVTAEPPGPHCANGGVKVQVGSGAPEYICGGASGSPGADGQSATVTAEPSGVNCASGGIKVTVGSGSPTYVCNGASGSGASVTSEPAGPNCASGGVKVQVGSGAPTYICNGAAGATGSSGASGANGLSASVTAEPAGPNCANGGVKVQVGTGTPTYVCNGVAGANGQSALVTAEPAGPNCANGGVKIQVGSGAATYVCNGATGATGPAGASAPCAGVPSLSVTSFTMSAGLPFIASIAVSYPGGTNALTYSFTGDGGNYVPLGGGSFSFVPNESGGPFTNYVLVSDGCQLASGVVANLYTPPADIAALTAGSIAGGQASVSWTNPTDANFDHVEITWSGGGGPIDIARTAPQNQQATLTGLGSANLTVTVKAMDAHGSRSAGVSAPLCAAPFRPYGGACVSCSDGIQDGDETDVDCGGSCGATCKDTNPQQKCKSGNDCTSQSCSGTPLLCQPPSCTDGVKNGNETDVDCGGSCTKCSNGQQCQVGNDCSSLYCSSGRCSARPQGAACTKASDCQTFSCADGVCCNMSCSGTCNSCSTGTCGNVPAGSNNPNHPCPSGQSCTAGGTCG